MLRRVALVWTDVSEEVSAFITVTRIGDLGTTLAVTSNRRTLRRNIPRFLSPWWWRRYVPPKRRLLQEPHGLTSQKTPFFIVTAVKTSNVTQPTNCCSFQTSWPGLARSSMVYEAGHEKLVQTNCAISPTHEEKSQEPNFESVWWLWRRQSSGHMSVERWVGGESHARGKRNVTSPGQVSVPV
jgi:hypothetical protein